MDIRQIQAYREILEEVRDLCTDILEAPARGKYRVYKELSAYTLELVETQETVLFRSTLLQIIKSAKELGIDMREVILDL
tara:strand:+ start:1351 stop:1590 length:240 start_codon:yes stop_codon:yes gene_type:complete